MIKSRPQRRRARSRTARQCLFIFAALTAFSVPALVLKPSFASAQQKPGVPGIVLKEADPSEKGTGRLSPAAAAAKAHGPLPSSKAAGEAKAAANAAARRAALSGASRAMPGDLSVLGGEAGPKGAPLIPQSPVPLAPTIFAGLNFPGQGNPATNKGSPPDTTGAIGTTRYIQLVNTEAGIFNRANGALLAKGTLNQLAGLDPEIVSFDPQIIWDGQTDRFYYVMDSIFSDTDNRLSFGFSKTSSPANVTTAFCHYTLGFKTRFPDYPKLGDSKHFIIIGSNVFDGFGPFLGSNIVAISKPPPGTSCPPANSFKFGEKFPLFAEDGVTQVFTPVPSNQIDTWPAGYVVTTTSFETDKRLWFFNIGRNSSTGFPTFGSARKVIVGSYSIPPSAAQPGASQVLDTLDGRNTQAVQAINPRRGTFSFWTQHTILSRPSGNASGVRWYEIDPVPAGPVILRTGTIQSEPSFLFNAAISPDRMVNGIQRLFGDSFVIEYNVSGAAGPPIFPRIVAGSSAHGGPLQFALIRNGVGPYIDFTCPFSGFQCRWGDYSGAAPDPVAPTGANIGLVWGTNQFSGVAAPSPSLANWVTRIFALKP
ncbi:MAG: hypothetical protein L0Y57_02555 [Beijerinckiaceae bacterium]|nr:hypothetical protein [Beijerinckiaceae bacterium]